MIKKELNKRILTSLFLLLLLVSMYFYFYILIISLIIISILAWIEFYGLISKIFKKKKNIDTIFRFIYKSISLIYLTCLSLGILIIFYKNDYFQVYIVYSLLVSITSDLGGMLFGKIFKGKKLTKISPNKTISGSLGSFICSLTLIPFFLDFFLNHNILILLIITLLISLTSQLGDLFISLLKRKANVKNTSDLLPGHGGVLDRIDGMLFAIPVGFIIFGIF
ncbi:phosphatidate cytidylyltransferase [Candidatus Pelagibacter ubique]|uniref:Phosphatidate cytidylyltransferase n=1 Tax=Pelagibacter ubique TaxID=198252 RepID=A0ABX1T3S2_PELUQ|nr:phosphatidate cytidylyltransferase [Candidatus Pelagibacter ubique]NMN68094.1 phosphatidate cytidylyltransferase [Candidatus Pelagibacter ubique]